MLYYIFLEAKYFKLKVDGYIEFQCGLSLSSVYYHKNIYVDNCVAGSSIYIHMYMVLICMFRLARNCYAILKRKDCIL